MTSVSAWGQAAHLKVQPTIKDDLFNAIELRNVASVRRLLKRGADPNAAMMQQVVLSSPYLRTAIEASVHMTQWEIAEMVEITNSESAPHQDAVVSILRLLLRAGGDASKGAPLVDAMYGKNWRAADILLRAGANVNAVLPEHSTALAYCSYQPTLYRELLRRHAKVNARDASGRSALFFAARSGDSKFVKRLIDAGADLSYTDVEGENALSAGAAHPDVVRILLSYGAVPPRSKKRE
jgi:hypothetical protein